MNHLDAELTRFEPKLISVDNGLGKIARVAIMEIEKKGTYCKFDDVKKFLNLVAEKVRALWPK